MATSQFTDVQVLFAKAYTASIVNDQMTTAKDGLSTFIENEKQIIPATSDYNRTIIRSLALNTGTNGVVDSAGVPQGTDYRASETFVEGTPITMTEKAGTVKIIARDLKIMTDKLSAVNLNTDAGRNTAMRIFQDVGFIEKVKKDAVNDLVQAEKTALLAVFNNLKTLTAPGGDEIVANSGTVLQGDNLISNAFAPEILDLILQHARGMKNSRGLLEGFTTPKYFFTTAQHLADAYRLFSPNMTQNVNYKNVFDYFVNNQTMVDAVALNADFSLAIGGAHGVDVLMETAEPTIRMNYDENGNLKIIISRISGFGVNARSNIVQIDHA